MGDQKIRVSDTVYSQIKALAEKTGKSIRELAEEAITAYLLGREGVESKEIKGITSKIITLQYPAKCRKCGKQLKAGDLAYWVKITYTDNSVRSYVICLDCYYSSSALKEYYLKKKQLEQIIRGLKREADKLAEEVLKLRAEKSIYELKRELGRLIADANDLLVMTSDPEREKAVREVIERLNKIDEHLDKLEELEQALDYLKEKARGTLKRVRKLRADIERWDRW